MNKQQIFDKVLNHLRKQGVAAVDTETGACLYRTKENYKCAIGCLIPDELYKTEMEQKSCRKIIHRSIALQKYLDINEKNQDIDFLEAMQNAHDTELVISFEAFNSAMEHIAERFDLTYRK